MAHTKQTARKNSSRKPPAMGKPKPQPKPVPKPGGRTDRKVIIEYSSDESFHEERPQPVEGSGAPKQVTKQIHLTLSTSLSHVTTTETFTIFFINYDLTKTLRKAFEKRGWSSDNMQELMTNFLRKHGKKIPLPKIYADKDSSDSEGLELQDRSMVGRKTPDGSTGGKLGRKPSAGSAGGSGGASSSGGGAGGSGGARGSGSIGGTGGGAGGSGGTGGSGGSDPGRGRKCSHDDDNPDDDPNKCRKTDPTPKPPRKEPGRRHEHMEDSTSDQA